MGATFELARTFRCLGETLAVRDPESAAQWFKRAVDMHGGMSAEYELSLTLAGQERVLHGTA
jgi:hypothetical protein